MTRSSPPHGWPLDSDTRAVKIAWRIVMTTPPSYHRWIWLTLLSVLWMLRSVAHADLRIHDVTADSRNLFHNADRGDASHAQSIQLQAGTHDLRFAFTDDAPTARPALRLRYKLEGQDQTWNDLPAKVRVLVRFFDRYEQLVGSDEFAMAGQTPGWRGTAETSEFVERREQTVAPPGSASVRLAFLSTGDDATVGIIGIDAVRISVEHPPDRSSRTFDCAITTGTNLSAPLGTPINWMREGTRAELAQLRTRPTPAPHRILVIEDDDAQRFGNWSLNPGSAAAVSPGDRVIVQWQAAHSLGRSRGGEAQYAGLAPGNYWFRVTAVKPNGEPTGVEISLPVVVSVPVYRRIEFWIVAAALAVALAAWIGRIVARKRMQRRLDELQRQQALEQERARIARDLHDEVGAGLTAIAMQSDWVRRELAEAASPEARRRIESVCQAAIELTRSVDEIVWAVNPTNDTLEHFINYLTQCSEQFADATGLNIRFDIPPNLPRANLTGDRRHRLFLAVLEALNNTAKHAQASTLKLSVRIEARSLRILLEDDGRGFVAEDSAGTGNENGNGLKNMRSRMEQLGGRFAIVSQPGQGTRVEFVLSLDDGTPSRRPS